MEPILRVPLVTVRIIVVASLFVAAAMFTIGSASAAAAPASELCDGYAACSVHGYSTHGYQVHAGTSYWEMEAGDECTNYVAFVESSAYRVPEPGYGLGNAGSWGANARAHGVEVNQTPSVGSVAEWYGDSYGIGPDGHVAVVEQVGCALKLAEVSPFTKPLYPAVIVGTDPP